MQCLRTCIFRGALTVLITFNTGALSAKVGFGFGPFKKPIELQSRQPAAVRLANTSLYFEGASTNKEYFPVQDSLLVTLGTELISHEKTLVVKDKREDAEWTFAANVTGYAVAPPATKTEQSDKKTLVYTVWNGSLNVAYRVIDKNGKIYDAANIDYNYHQQFESSATGDKSRFDISGVSDLKKMWKGTQKKSNEVVPASDEDLKQILIREVVRRIASKLGNTTQGLDVQVAGGEENLNHAAEFMKNGLWARALEALQKAPTFPKPDEESFHQYDLGVVYEAMSYESKSSVEQRENISKAAELYDKALEMNPNEKYFVATIARARDAVARFQALEKMKQQDLKEQKVQASSAPAKTVETSNLDVEPLGKTKAKAVTIADAIQMRSEGVPDEQIIEYVRSAPVVDFNPTDKETMISMAKSKLPVPVQNVFREKVKAPLLPTPRPARAEVSKKTQ